MKNNNIPVIIAIIVMIAVVVIVGTTIKKDDSFDIPGTDHTLHIVDGKIDLSNISDDDLAELLANHVLPYDTNNLPWLCQIYDMKSSLRIYYMTCYDPAKNFEEYSKKFREIANGATQQISEEAQRIIQEIDENGQEPLH